MNNVIRVFLKKYGIDIKKKRVEVTALLDDAREQQKNIKGPKEDLGRNHDQILYNQNVGWLQKKCA